MDPHIAQVAALKSKGSPSERPTKSCGNATVRERLSPTNKAGVATTNPAIGPAIPMSKSMRFVGIFSRIRMNAPSVPVSRIGAGRKYGSDALTR